MTEPRSFNVYQKLMAVRMGFLKHAPKKSGKNEFGGFTFFELSDIVPILTDLCTAMKAATVFDFRGDTATVRFIDCEKPEDYIEVGCPKVTTFENKKMNAMQIEGSIETYTRRYLYLALFDIVEADVIDNTAGKPEPQQKQKPKPEQKLSSANKAELNRAIIGTAKVLGITNKEATRKAEEIAGVKMSAVTDANAEVVVDALDEFIYRKSEEAMQGA